MLLLLPRKLVKLAKRGRKRKKGKIKRWSEIVKLQRKRVKNAAWKSESAARKGAKRVKKVEKGVKNGK